MNRKPLRTLRSDWAHHENTSLQRWPWPVTVAERRVFDGILMVIAADEPVIGWHLSISHRGHNGRLCRYPTWDEIADARDVFLPADLGFVMHLPPADEYVALHDTTFHLHQHPAAETTA